MGVAESFSDPHPSISIVPLFAYVESPYAVMPQTEALVVVPARRSISILPSFGPVVPLSKTIAVMFMPVNGEIERAGRGAVEKDSLTIDIRCIRVSTLRIDINVDGAFIRKSGCSVFGVQVDAISHLPFSPGSTSSG